MHPRNDVERLLQDLHEGRTTPDLFAKHLLEQQVFMPVQDEKHVIKGFQSSTQARPLVLDTDEGTPVMILFSDPERAKGFLAEFPGFGGGILTEFSWIVRRLGANMGIALNPDHDLGFDFDPEMVAMMAALLPEEAE
ncbi:MAG TPA: SseB family protein [Thiobacillaceae bacterium]|nr:SseB family protein [Thiobacillaceae bacterium]